MSGNMLQNEKKKSRFIKFHNEDPPSDQIEKSGWAYTKLNNVNTEASAYSWFGQRKNAAYKRKVSDLTGGYDDANKKLKTWENHINNAKVNEEAFKDFQTVNVDVGLDSEIEMLIQKLKTSDKDQNNGVLRRVARYFRTTARSFVRKLRKWCKDDKEDPDQRLPATLISESFDYLV